MKGDNDNYYFEHGDFLVLQECPDEQEDDDALCQSQALFILHDSVQALLLPENLILPASLVCLSQGFSCLIATSITHLDCLLICLYPTEFLEEKNFIFHACVL